MQIKMKENRIFAYFFIRNDQKGPQKKGPSWVNLVLREISVIGGD